MDDKVSYERPILQDPLGADGLFVIPKDFGVDDEVRWAKKRMDAARVSMYADSHCGLSNTYDSAGAYLCGGRQDGSSSPCNKLQVTECLIRKIKLTNPNKQSCEYWEIKNAGDPEPRYGPEGKLEDKRISFGDTPNPLGFGCIRCEYGEGELPHLDSEGRNRWCALKGFPVEDTACCAENEPDVDDPDDDDMPTQTKKSIGARLIGIRKASS